MDIRISSFTKIFLIHHVILLTISHSELQTTLRLSWMIQNNKKLQIAIEKKTALFGTLDSWLLHRLRQGNHPTAPVEHISDVTSCSATGFFDPFTLGWAKWAMSLFSIKVSALNIAVVYLKVICLTILLF